jgi:DNA-binding NtrC family response regulator
VSTIAPGPPAPAPDLAGRTLAEIEKEAIEQALAASGGRRGKAAQVLGISRRSLYDRIRRLGIHVPG